MLGVAARDTLGNVITADRMTVYVYTLDKPGESVCYDICAMNWPPLLVTHTPTLAASFPGRFGSTTRKDGTKQGTYNGQPPGPMILVSALAALFILVTGTFYFRRMEKTFADVV